VLLNTNTIDEGAWYEVNSEEAKFKWKLSKKLNNVTVPYEFQVKLSPDGIIAFWHDSIAVGNYELFYSGISNGDKSNFQITEYQNTNAANLFNTDIYTPKKYPDSLRINQQGLLECTPIESDVIYKLPVKVTDDNLVSDEEEFEINPGVLIGLRFHSGNDSILSEGETVNADLVITNLTAQSHYELNGTLSINDQLISISDSIEILQKLEPFEVITIPSAFRFSIKNPIVNPYNILIELRLEGNSLSLRNSFPKEIYASILQSIDLQCKKNNNELIQPGEVSGFVYHFINSGYAIANDLLLSIHILSSEAKLISNNNQLLGNLKPGCIGNFEFEVSADDSAFLGALVPVEVIISTGNQVKLIDTLYFRIGKLPAIVVDMDPKHESAIEIYQQIQDLTYECDYTTEFPQQLIQFQSVFLNLGKYADRYKLNYLEASALAEYLDQGGNLYLESPNFWKNDLITKLNSYFEIMGTAKTHVYDTLTGTKGLFLEGYRFYNTDFQMSTHHLLPYNQGKPILQDGSFCSAVATTGGKYKTIGSIFSIKGMQGLNDSSTRKNLVKKYIDFFALKQNTIGINDKPSASRSESVNIMPNPAHQSVLITFDLKSKSPVTLTIFDIHGNRVIDLADEKITEEKHRIEWNLCRKTGQRVSPGLYFCRIISGKEVILGKIMVK
jgi:hypothetical protein